MEETNQPISERAGNSFNLTAYDHQNDALRQQLIREQEELVAQLALDEAKRRELWRPDLNAFVFDRDFFHVAFNSEAYLHDFYSKLEEPAMRLVHMYLPMIVARMPKGGRMLDFGAGPTVHLGCCFRNSVDEIYFADYLPQNRAELQRWKDRESAFDWSLIYKTIATWEGNGEQWARVEEETRAKVRGVFHCDAFQDPAVELPPDVESQFDVITTTYCLEYCTNGEEEYKKAITNVIKHVKPGGYFFMAGILEETWCAFGGRKFTCNYITEEFMLTTLRDAGITVDDSTSTYYYNIEGVFLLAARKALQ